MADDVKTDEKTETKGEPESKDKPQMVPIEKFKDLEDRYANMEATLKALAKPMSTQQRQANPQQADLQDRISIIARRLNAEPETVRQWDPFLSTYFEEISRPYITALANMADKLEQIEARSEIPDYGTYAKDIDTERQTRIQRGEYLAPREAYHLIRSRKMPEILETERAKAVEEARHQQHTTDSATEAVSGTEQKAGPTPTKQSGPLTKEAFDRLSIDDKEKALENLNF